MCYRGRGRGEERRRFLSERGLCFITPQSAQAFFFFKVLEATSIHLELIMQPIAKEYRERGSGWWGGGVVRLEFLWCIVLTLLLCRFL